MPPREIVPIDTSYREAPNLSELEPANHIELEYAEPSPFMEVISGAWNRMIFLTKAALFLAVVGAYPAMTLVSHQVDDSTIVFPDGYEWSVGEIGKTVTMVARIVEGSGWAADKPKWHPQSRLTATPAWQKGIVSANADYTRLLAVQTGNEDLAAAARLLTPADEAMEDRLLAAAEALAQYDRQAEGGHAETSSGIEALEEKLKLATGWADDEHIAVLTQVRQEAPWPASYSDIETYYHAKAYAHVAHELISSAIEGEKLALQERGLMAQAEEALAVWRKTAVQDPMFVMNQDGANALQGNHLTHLAFLLGEASLKTAAFTEALSNPALEPQDTQSAELTVAATPSP